MTIFYIKRPPKSIDNFDSGELDKDATVRKFRTVRQEGSRNVARILEFFNLDVVISVGYRVNTVRVSFVSMLNGTTYILIASDGLRWCGLLCQMQTSKI